MTNGASAPRYEVRPYEGSWVVYDRHTRKYLATSTDKNRVQEWVEKWNAAHEAGTLEQEKE